MDKRGITNAHLILMIVGILILLAIVGGIISWGLVKETRPDPVSEQCKFACDSGQKSAFCDVERNLNDGTKSTCNNLANQNKFGVESCPSIDCNAQEVIDQTCVTGLGGEWINLSAEGTCPTQEGKFARKLASTDSPQAEGQICCYYYE